MGAQILRISHLHSKFDQSKIAPRPVLSKGDKTNCPICGGHRGASVTNTLKHGAVVLCMVITLLAALALITGISIAALQYAANETTRTFYEMNYSQVPPNGR
jgi:uncharacterized Zn-binding protein involved in type VI secretion